MKAGEKIFLRIIYTIVTGFIVHFFAIEEQWQNLTFVDEIDNIEFAIFLFVLFFIFTVLDYLLYKFKFVYMDEWIFVISLLIMGMLMLMNQSNVYLSVITTLVVIIAIRCILLRFPLQIGEMDISTRKSWLIIGVVALITFVYVGALVVIRYLLLITPNFDFGIFSQMYYYMKETGLPMTTCERNCYLSHFAIHFSPIYYLILPIYMIFSSPITLLVVQLLVILSGCIPLYKLCKSKKYSQIICVSFAVLYLLYPALRSGLFYDFHENKFLPALIMWLLYFLESTHKKPKVRNIGIAVFTLLTLMVKEDAAIYVACIGLFWLAYRKEKQERIKGVVLLAGSVIYFVIVFYCLNRFGASTSVTSIGRYDNLMTEQNHGLINMVMNIVKNPAYAVKTLLTMDKVEFILWTMFPFLFVPLLHKKATVYILIIPYVVMNLLTDYSYQFDIGYQYAYGSTTLLIYMAVLWFEGKDTIKKRTMIALMVIATFLMTTGAIGGKNRYFEEIKQDWERNQKAFEAMEQIPKKYSVTATTWFVPALSERKVVYEYMNDKDMKTDVYVFDMREVDDRDYNEPIIEEKLANGYEIYNEEENCITILKKKVEKVVDK